MKLYLLRPKKADNWEPWYDKSFGFVIRARSAKQARRIADENAGDENRGEFIFKKTSDEKHPWLNPAYSSCVQLTSSGKEELIMKDFWAA